MGRARENRCLQYLFLSVVTIGLKWLNDKPFGVRVSSSRGTPSLVGTSSVCFPSRSHSLQPRTLLAPRLCSETFVAGHGLGPLPSDHSQGGPIGGSALSPAQLHGSTSLWL